MIWIACVNQPLIQSTMMVRNVFEFTEKYLYYLSSFSIAGLYEDSDEDDCKFE